MNQPNQSLPIQNWRHKEKPRRPHPSNGLLPPQNLEAEKAVIGAILLESNKCEDVLEIIHDPEVFYSDTHKEVFQSVLNVKQSSQMVDMLTVTEDLMSRGKLESVGGPHAIAMLTNAVVSSGHVLSHSRILIEKWVLRETIKMCHDTMASAYESDADVFDIVENANRELDKISFKNLSKEMVPLSKELLPTLQQIESERKSEGQLLGVTSGISAIDEATNGWKSPNLIILAARPSVGKTALALNFAYHGSVDKPTAVFSYEMGNEELTRRLLSIDTLVPYSEIQTPTKMGDLNWSKVQQAPGLGKRKIFMNDDRSTTTSQMLSICRRLKKKQGLGLIIVDYLQLMPEDKRAGNREQQIAKISRDLKGIAKDLKVPVIALSQMSRDIEKGGAREPNLSDLRESGAIEQDADIVFFLYGPSEDEIKQDASKEHEKYLKAAKFRGGIRSKILLYADLSTQRFLDKEPFSTVFNPRTGITNDYSREPDFSTNVQTFEDNEELPF